MSYYIFSSESLPNPDMMGVPGYTPDGEYIRWHGIHLGVIQKNQWQKLPDFFTSYRRPSWRSPKEEFEVPIRVFKPVVESPRRDGGGFGQRGVIILDHEPNAEEKRQLEARSRSLNLVWRMKVVKDYEDAVREKEVTGFGRTKPTPYEDECYEILGLIKPYSVEAMRAQRHPGEAVGEQIVAALEKLEARRNKEADERTARLPKPKPEPVLAETK